MVKESGSATLKVRHQQDGGLSVLIRDVKSREVALEHRLPRLKARCMRTPSLKTLGHKDL